MLNTKNRVEHFFYLYKFIKSPIQITSPSFEYI